MNLRTTLRRTGACALAVITAGAVAVVLPGSAAATPTQPRGSISGSTAQAVHANIAGVSVGVSNTPLDASNDGAQSNALQTNSPGSGPLADLDFLGVGALKESAAANEHGFAYSCAGIVSPKGNLHLGGTPKGTECTAGGNGSGGLTLDLSKLGGGLGSGLLSTLANVELTADAITAHAYDDAHGPLVRGATILNLKLHVHALLGVLDFTIPVSLGSTADGTLEPNQNLLKAIVDGLTDKLNTLGPVLKALLAPIVDAVSDLLKNVISLTANYQPAGTGSVSALHVQVLGKAGTLDLATAAVGVGCTVKPFHDVWKGNPFCVDITWSHKNQVTYGSSPTNHNYQPRHLVSRGQFAAFLHRLVKSGTAAAPCAGPRPFKDVPRGNVFCKDIKWLKNSDISEGFNGGKFHLGATLTRQNIAAQLYRLAHNGNHAPKCSASAHPFPDVDRNTNFCGAIRWLKTTGIAQGDSNGHFNPRQSITRQSMAGFLMQYDRFVLS